MKISHILLVFSALFCIAPPVIAQGSIIAEETVIISVDDHLITFAEFYKEADRIFHQNPLMAQQAGLFQAITNLVRRALTLQTALKFAVPLAQFRSLADEFTSKEIEQAGSLNDFLLEKNSELGILDKEEFADYIYNEYVYIRVMSIVLGNQQTAGKGLRVILAPSPAEIRSAYKENQEFRMAQAVLKWSYLSFYKKPGSAQTPGGIVTNALAGLDNGSISAQELIDLADNDLKRIGQPEDTAAWIIDFVSNASAGEYAINPKSDLGSQGNVSMILITENLPAREYSFEEAQPIIIKRLTDKKRNVAVVDFFAKAVAEVDVWVTDDIPGLKDLVSQMIGRYIPANSPEEL